MAEEHVEREWLRTISLIIIATIACAMALYYVRIVAVPFVIAVFIMSMVAPLMDHLILRYRFPHILAVAATLIVVLTVITLIGMFFVAAVDNMVNTGREYSDSFVSLLEQAADFLQRHGLVQTPGDLTDALRQQLMSALRVTFSAAATLIPSAVLVLIFVMFLLAGRNPRAIRTGFYSEIDRRIRRYINLKVTMSLMTGLLTWGILSLLGLEMAMVFGLSAFLLNFIPSLGSMVATLLPLPMAIAQFEGDHMMIVAAVVLPGSVQMFIGNILEPQFVGEGLELHPVTVLMSLSFWGLLWGPAGMVLAVPIAATIRIFLMHFETVRPIGLLMSGKLPQPPAQRK